MYGVRAIGLRSIPIGQPAGAVATTRAGSAAHVGAFFPVFCFVATTRARATPHLRTWRTEARLFPDETGEFPDETGEIPLNLQATSYYAISFGSAGALFP